MGRTVRLACALAVLVLALGGAAQADAPRDVGAASRVSVEQENVYIQQSLRAHYLLGWNRGSQQDSWWDWRMGLRYTFEPWAIGYPRDVWTQTPGQRFAFWWTQYCFINCDNPPTEEQIAQLAQDFDAALEKIGR